MSLYYSKKEVWIFPKISVGIGSILKTTFIFKRQNNRTTLREVYYNVLHQFQVFKLPKWYLFCLANFKIFGMKNIFSPAKYAE